MMVRGVVERCGVRHMRVIEVVEGLVMMNRAVMFEPLMAYDVDLWVALLHDSSLLSLYRCECTRYPPSLVRSFAFRLFLGVAVTIAPPPNAYRACTNRAPSFSLLFLLGEQFPRDKRDEATHKISGHIIIKRGCWAKSKGRNWRPWSST
jgi:hypothetical protein